MKLNDRIHIQKKEISGPLKDNTFIDITSLWAQIENIDGKEYVELEKINSKLYIKAIVRYSKSLDSTYDTEVTRKYRIKYNTNLFNIKSSIPIKNKEYLRITLESE